MGKKYSKAKKNWNVYFMKGMAKIKVKINEMEEDELRQV